ncbi:response regulator transcription factor [Paenibacillus antri]|uniref:Response regulator transcription factor n=1 Tax=Paenibacillus antri TaxID=2582848 RepID=A0A5R9G457_9BACL|nr:response regulator transcription factor [Paenibacillus antri]TLS48920.1 response regulator transcription factor [Paenibacillus antri]
MTEKIRILIADDHPLFRKGLRAMLESQDRMEVIGEAANGAEAVELALANKPDVVLMDLQMPGGGGIASTRRIRDGMPSIKVLVLTLFEDNESVFMSLRAGASGYILKDAEEEEVFRAILAVANGEAIFSPAVASRVLAFFSNKHISAPKEIFPMLTEREREILVLLAKGKSNSGIAKELRLSVKTVSNYVSNIFNKLQVADRAEAMLRAKEAGL